MLCALAALILATHVGAQPRPTDAQMAHAAHALHSAKDLAAASTWQPVADIVARAIGRTRDWRVAGRRLKAAEGDVDVLLDHADDYFEWCDYVKPIRYVGGRHSGLLGYAWVRLIVDGEDSDAVDDTFLCLFWFERRARIWRGQPLFIGSMDRPNFPYVLEPQDALSTRDTLVVTGHNADDTNFSGSGAIVFRRHSGKWVFKQKIVSRSEAPEAHFGRVHGRKDIRRLIVKLRCYLESMNMVSHAGAKHYYLENYRFENGRYRYWNTVSVPSAVATLDDMMRHAHARDLSWLRKRCATPGQVPRFVAMVSSLGDLVGFASGREPDDDATVFEIDGTGTRLHYRHVARGWILSSMRKVR